MCIGTHRSVVYSVNLARIIMIFQENKALVMIHFNYRIVKNAVKKVVKKS